MATALCTCCAERIRAMQLVCMCASSTCTGLFMRICAQEDMEVQVLDRVSGKKRIKVET